MRLEFRTVQRPRILDEPSPMPRILVGFYFFLELLSARKRSNAPGQKLNVTYLWGGGMQGIISLYNLLKSSSNNKRGLKRQFKQRTSPIRRVDFFKSQFQFFQKYFFANFFFKTNPSVNFLKKYISRLKKVWIFLKRFFNYSKH